MRFHLLVDDDDDVQDYGDDDDDYDDGGHGDDWIYKYHQVWCPHLTLGNGSRRKKHGRIFLTKHHTLYELFLEPFPKMNRPLKGILKQRTKEADKNFDNIYC